MAKIGKKEQFLCNGIDSEHNYDNYACISRSEMGRRIKRYRVFHSDSQLFAKKYVPGVCKYKKEGKKNKPDKFVRNIINSYFLAAIFLIK